MLLSSVSASTAAFYFDTSDGNDTSFTLSEIIRSSAVMLQINTDRVVSCKYSVFEGTSYANMEEEFDFSFGTLHKKELIGLGEEMHHYYVKCKDSGGVESGQFEAIFGVNVPVSARIVLEEEDDPLREGEFEIMVVTSKVVSETPSLSYSFDGTSYSPIPLFGSGTAWQGYLVISDTNEEMVGSFRFQGRDLEGISGTQITDGGLFLVDTISPGIVSDIDAVGYEGEIRVSWYLDEDDVKEYRVYRSTSPNVDYSDFLKSASEDDEFKDTSVEKGETYYYRIGATDEAGNDGGLSREVYATALREEVSSDSGLEIRFHGKVDGLLEEIDYVSGLADDAKSGFDRMGEKEGMLFEHLKLEREINGAKSELNSFRKEVGNYKSQNLNEVELDKKLNSGKLRINTIKKKIPESVVVVSEKSIDGSFSEEDAMEIVLRLRPAISESLARKIVEESLRLMNDEGFVVKRKGYNLGVVYLDGSGRDVSLVIEEVELSVGRNDSLSLLESIPLEIAESVSKIEVKNVDYQVAKEDAIVSFASDTSEIVYSLEDHIDFGYLSGVKTLVLVELEEERAGGSALTGYFSFVDLGEMGGSYLGLILGVLVVAGLGGYLFFIRRNGRVSEGLVPVRQIIHDAEENLIKGKIDIAKEIYHSASLHYKHLEEKEKKVIYKELNKLHKKIGSFMGG